MNILVKLKETVTSVLPVMLIVFILGLTVAPLGASLMLRFLIGGVLLILGLTVFLLGVDIGIRPLGEQTGAALVSKRNLFILLSVSFVIGFLVTVAEPDIQVFGDQIHSVFSAVDKTGLVYIIAAGVGLLITIGLLRSILNWPLKITLLVLYIGVFILAYFTPESFRGIAFDSGGATTGPMTVPFILAIGIGVSSVRSTGADKDSESFGLTGITSVGPIMAVLAYGMFLSLTGALDSENEIFAESENIVGLGIFLRLIPNVAKEAALSILPLFILFVFFQLFLLHLPPRKVAKVIVGLVYSFVGLTIFLVGVNGGFMDAGKHLGTILGGKAAEFGGFWNILLIFTGVLLGAVVVCAEPAVWVLTEQVENLSGGTIKRKLMLTFLAAGSAVAIGLTMWRALQGFSIMRIIVPGYALALILMIFCPKLFTAIAFDSGGVASGPITSTFVLSFTIGASHAAGGSSDAFGVIALVAMTPLIAIQILGILFVAKKRKNKITTKMEEN
mgnify:FL=1